MVFLFDIPSWRTFEDFERCSMVLYTRAHVRDCVPSSESKLPFSRFRYSLRLFKVDDRDKVYFCAVPFRLMVFLCFLGGLGGAVE